VSKQSNEVTAAVATVPAVCSRRDELATLDALIAAHTANDAAAAAAAGDGAGKLPSK
jgi:hypothetical protein